MFLTQVDIIEDEAAGKRTIRTTTICWGNKLSLLVSTPFYDPRLPANANDPDLDFSQAQTELNTEADWQKVLLHLQTKPADVSHAILVTALQAADADSLQYNMILSHASGTAISKSFKEFWCPTALQMLHT